VTSSRPLHDAIRALAPSGIEHHVGQAPEGASAPWLVLTVETPDSQRSEAGTHVAGTGRLHVTVAARTEDEAHHWLDEVHAAWRSARVSAAGWQVGTLVQTQQSGPYPAGRTATDTNLQYQVAQVWFSFTCSPTAS
jgi:hypothetical protein